MSEQKPSFAVRRPLMASAAALAIAASGVFALTLPQGATAQAGALQAPASVAENAPSFADVVSHVKPAVVSVKVNIEDAAASEDSDESEQVPPEMRKFFKQFGGGQDFGKPIVRHGVALGSGFIISADGYVVTNNHVVEHGGKAVTVTLDSGKEVQAKVIGADAKTDLALLKINEGSRLSLREARQAGAAHRRLGAGDRQPVRPRRHGDGRHRLGGGPRHRLRSL